MLFALLMIVPPHRLSHVLYDSGMVDPVVGLDVDYDYLTTKWDGQHAVDDNANLPAVKA